MSPFTIWLLTVSFAPTLLWLWCHRPQKIDPAAKAVIDSMRDQPERWIENENNYLSLDKGRWEGATVSIYKYEERSRATIDRPNIRVNRSSERAMYRAHLRWKATQAQTIEQMNYARLIEALEGREQ